MMAHKHMTRCPTSLIIREIQSKSTMRYHLMQVRVQFSSVAQLCQTLCNPMDCSMPGLPVHYQLAEFTQLMFIETVVHLTISCSVFPFSSHLQSFPASGPFQMSQFFTSGGQNIGVSTSASVLPMNIQDRFPLAEKNRCPWFFSVLPACLE